MKLLDAEGRELSIGDRVTISGFEPPEGHAGTVSNLLEGTHGGYTVIDFPDFTTLSDPARANGRCPDLQLIQPTEEAA